MKVSDFYSQAMEGLISESGWRVTDGVIDLSQCETTVTENQIINKAQELFDKWQSLSYQRERAEQYPSIQDQLDMQYHDSVNGTTTWKDAVAKVKAENPKPE